MENVYEVGRWINVVLYAFALIGVIAQWRNLFNPEKLPGARGWFVAWVAVAMYSTAEVLLLEQPAGPRVLMSTVVLGGFDFSLWVRTVQSWLNARSRKIVRRTHTIKSSRAEETP